MISLKKILKEALLKEFDKSKLDFIARKLNISPEDKEYQKVMNALNTQGIKYPDLKQSIEKGEIKSFDDIKSLKTTSKTDVKKQEKSNVEVILDNGNFLIIQPKTYKANCYYGSGTKWCTTGKEDGKDYFKDYTTKGSKFYIIIDKSKPVDDVLYKVGAHFDFNVTSSYYDKENKKWVNNTGLMKAEFFDTEDNQIYTDKYFEYLKSKGIDSKKLFGMEWEDMSYNQLAENK